MKQILKHPAIMKFGKISEETDGWLNYTFWSERRSKVIIHGDETRTILQTAFY
jgi:hypothetical protein